MKCQHGNDADTCREPVHVSFYISSAVDPTFPEVRFTDPGEPGWLRPAVGGYWYRPTVNPFIDTEIGW